MRGINVRVHWFGLLPLFYFLVITPLGFVRRCWRRNYPGVEIDRSLDTYWLDRATKPAQKLRPLIKT